MRIGVLVVLMAEVLAIVFLDKVARDRLLRLRGYLVNDLVVRQRSLAAALAQAGYLLGVLLGFLGAITFANQATSFLSALAHVALFGVLAVALQLAADWLGDVLIFRPLGPRAAVEDTNTSHALAKAAVSVATGLVLRGSMSDPSAGLLACTVWFLVGQALMVLAVLLYCRLTPYDDMAEIKRDNLAASFPIAGILLGVGFVIEAAVATKGAGTLLETVLHVAIFFGVSLVLVYVFRLLASRVLLPHAKVAEAIVRDRSVAAGLQEGISFLLVALIVTFFLS
jgi:uncharacterized membrane protein YjfL (UPF0719 family)